MKKVYSISVNDCIINMQVTSNQDQLINIKTITVTQKNETSKDHNDRTTSKTINCPQERTHTMYDTDHKYKALIVTQCSYMNTIYTKC